MSVPLATTRGAEVARCLLSAAEAGKTDSSAPHSTRKDQPELETGGQEKEEDVCSKFLGCVAVLPPPMWSSNRTELQRLHAPLTI